MVLGGMMDRREVVGLLVKTPLFFGLMPFLQHGQAEREPLEKLLACGMRFASQNMCSHPLRVGERIVYSSFAFLPWGIGESRVEWPDGREKRVLLTSALFEIKNPPWEDLQLDGVTYVSLMPRSMTPRYDLIPYPLPTVKGLKRFIRAQYPPTLFSEDYPRVLVDLLRLRGDGREEIYFIQTTFIYPVYDPAGVAIHLKREGKDEYTLMAVYWKDVFFRTYDSPAFRTPSIEDAVIEEEEYTSIRDLLLGREVSRTPPLISMKPDDPSDAIIPVTRLRFRMNSSAKIIRVHSTSDEEDPLRYSWTIRSDHPCLEKGCYLPVRGIPSGETYKETLPSSKVLPRTLSAHARILEDILREEGCPTFTLMIEKLYDGVEPEDLL